MEERHLEGATRILKSIKYMTLATVCEDGSPWNSPVAPTFDESLTFRWGSGEATVHSQNIRRDPRVFVVIYDSTAPEGLGEGVYMQGKAREHSEYEGMLRIYTFTPERVWINDEEQDENGKFLKDIRVEIKKDELVARLAT